jgi:hypothetical protein
MGKSPRRFLKKEHDSIHKILPRKEETVDQSLLSKGQDVRREEWVSPQTTHEDMGIRASYTVSLAKSIVGEQSFLSHCER